MEPPFTEDVPLTSRAEAALMGAWENPHLMTRVRLEPSAVAQEYGLEGEDAASLVEFGASLQAHHKNPGRWAGPLATAVREFRLGTTVMSTLTLAELLDAASLAADGLTGERALTRNALIPARGAQGSVFEVVINRIGGRRFLRFMERERVARHEWASALAEELDRRGNSEVDPRLRDAALLARDFAEATAAPRFQDRS